MSAKCTCSLHHAARGYSSGPVFATEVAGLSSGSVPVVAHAVKGGVPATDGLLEDGVAGMRDPIEVLRAGG
jgi:hypothetical protein